MLMGKCLIKLYVIDWILKNRSECIIHTSFIHSLSLRPKVCQVVIVLNNFTLEWVLLIEYKALIKFVSL